MSTAKILDWRNPQMPVLVLHKARLKPAELIEATPEQVTKMARWRMRKIDRPHWREDRTYFMGRAAR